MLTKLSLLALCAAPLASALTLHVPSEPTSAGEVTITWDTAPGDPEAFTIELNHPSFNNRLAIANNIDPSSGSFTLVLPSIPAQDGYSLEAVNIGNIDDIYSVSGTFSIAPNPSTFSPGSSTRPATSASTGSAGASVTHSGSAAPSGSGASGSASDGPSASSSSAPPSVSNLAGDDEGSASTSVISRLGFLGAAVAGAIMAL